MQDQTERSGIDAAGSGPESSDDALDEFIGKLTEHQSNLRAYIMASIGNSSDAADVLQRTNLVLWRNASKFRVGAEFMPWAATLARYEILSFYRDRSRDRLVFSEDVALLMFQTSHEEFGNISERKEALQSCISKLPEKSRELLRLRYNSEKSTRQIAEMLCRTENAIRCTFSRIRKSLELCIDAKIRLDSN